MKRQIPFEIQFAMNSTITVRIPVTVPSALSRSDAVRGIISEE